MCRIYGHFNADTTARERATVAARQRHGGPDGHGEALGDRWSLGTNRLAVMDPAGGAQPYQLLGGAITIVFNGEIYNHNELRRDLVAHGYTFTDRCDGSILPALYHRYGDEFTSRVDGMYALAVLDQRAEPRLLLATDHLGMKPLYYHWDPSRRALYFASEIPALLGFSSVPDTLWSPGLESYLATKTPFGERTMFAGIKVVPPATTAVCDRAGLRSYRRHSNAEPRSTLRETLAGEVARLLRADVPVATITSGGLDSSLVTAFASGAVGEPLHTFNIAYTGSWPSDERRFAKEVAAHTGAVYRQVEIDPADFPELLTNAVRHLGQPNADPITLSTYALFKAVRAAGFPVALTGDAADEIFGGYSRMTTAWRAAAAKKPWFESYLDDLAVLPAKSRTRLYTKEYAAELRSAEPALPAEVTNPLRFGAWSGSGTVLRRIMDFERTYRLPAYHLRRVDHLSMASSVEVRLPFCQPSIVQIGQSLSDPECVTDAGVKRALYAAATGLLPESVLTRPKQPFTLPITAMLAPGWPLWEFANDLISPARLNAAGQIDPTETRRLLTLQANRPDDTTARTLWALLVHEVWRDQLTGARGRLTEVAA